MDDDERAVHHWAITEVYALRFLVKCLYLHLFRNLPDSPEDAAYTIESFRGTLANAEFSEEERGVSSSVKGAVTIFLTR